MDDKPSRPTEMQVERIFDHSRLGPELIAMAYESLVPIHRNVSSEQRDNTYDRKESVQWAM